ncbi:MAG: sulfotransferase, partial [Streptosporangiales bacterium]
TISATRGRPIFVLGCPRSGTTLLGLMLQAHPKIAIPPESRFLMPVYFRRHRFGSLEHAPSRRRLAQAIIKTPKFRDLGLDPEQLTEDIVANAGTVGAAFGLVFRSYADRFDKERWGDKRPGYHNYLWAIERLFPDAQYIHLVRDGRDCVASLKQMWWWQKSTHESVRAWMRATENVAAARQRMPAGSVHELRYEDLVTEPEKQLREMCDFLGEPFDERMLNPSSVADQVVPDYKTWHVNTHSAISTSAVGKFAERLEPWELRLCETVMADSLRSYGYGLTGADKAPQEDLEAYERVEAEKAGRVRDQQRRDEAKGDTGPVADMSPAQAQAERRARRSKRLELRVRGGVRRVARIAQGFADPASRPRYIAAAKGRLSGTRGGGAERCLACDAPKVRVASIQHAKDKQKVLRVRICGHCGHVANPGNTKDYSSFTNLGKMALRDRVGSEEHKGREYHMARLGSAILHREGLDVLVYGAGRSFDNKHIQKLRRVRKVAIADVMKLRDDAEFVDSNKPATRRFPLVLACEVIEHFLRPREEFRKLFSYVERDGLLVCSTNIYDGTDLSEHGYIFSKGHTSYYTPESLAAIARAHGYYVDFRVPRIATGKPGPRKRYVLFSKSRQVMENTACYFGRNMFAPAEGKRPKAGAKKSQPKAKAQSDKAGKAAVAS